MTTTRKNEPTFGKVVEYDRTTIHTVPASDLLEGDVILLPSVGKRAIRMGKSGQITLVFPRSGLAVVDGKKAGSLGSLDGHLPAIVGRVEGGWAASAPVTQPKAAKAKPARKVTKATTQTQKAKAPKAAVSNAELLSAALDGLRASITALEAITL